MKFQLEGFVAKLQSPITVEVDGRTEHYSSGSELAKHEFTERYEIKSVIAKNSEFFIELAKAESNPPMNFIGEEAIIYE